jgi:hypothetical protein
MCPKPPVIIVLGSAFGLALVIIAGAFFLGHRRPPLAPADMPESAGTTLPATKTIQQPVKSRSPVSPTRPPTVSLPAGPSSPNQQVGEAVVGEILDEGQLMIRLRSLEGTNPSLTLRLAREGNQRFPDGADAPERAWMVAKSLADMQRFKEAHDEAETMVKKYPGTSWSLDLQRHLLSNPLD